MMFVSKMGVLFAIAVLCIPRLTDAYPGALELKLPQVKIAVEHLVSGGAEADGGFGDDRGPNIEKIFNGLQEFFQSLSNETESEIETIFVNPLDTKGEIKAKLNAKIQGISQEPNVHEAFLHYTALLTLRDYGTVQSRLRLVLLGLPELAVQLEDIIADDSEKFYDECVELKRLGTTLLRSDRIKGVGVDLIKTIDQFIPCEKYASILYRFIAHQELPFPGGLPWGPGPEIPDDHFNETSTYPPHTPDFTNTIPRGSTPDYTVPRGSTPGFIVPRGSTPPDYTVPRGSTPGFIVPRGSTTDYAVPRGSTPRYIVSDSTPRFRPLITEEAT